MYKLLLDIKFDHLKTSIEEYFYPSRTKKSKNSSLLKY